MEPVAERAGRGSRPRLLFVSTVYPTPWEPAKGPANRSTVESLRLAGCEVRVVAPVPWIRRSGARATVEPPEQYPTYWYPPGVLRSHYHDAMHWSINATLRRLSHEFHPDAVLAFWTDPDGTVALKHARALGVPGGVIVGGSDVMLLPVDAARRRVISRTLAAADHVFAVGDVLRQRSIALGARADRASNFLCGVDLTRFGPGDRTAARARLGLKPEGSMLLWIGQMGKVKATERLLRAAVLLAAKFPDVTMALVGDGPRRTALQDEVDNTPALRGRVIFPGAVDHAALPDWYRAADLFVLPSRSEGVPNVLLEAMASGLPFVASDVGSINDLLPFGPSTTVPEGDIAALADAISTALRTGPESVQPKRFDRLDGARHLIKHLGLAQPKR